MISKKMQAMVNSSSAIRAMFEEGKRLASLWGEDKVFDFSLGNPNIAPPAAVADAVRAELQADDPVFLHGYMSNAGYDDVRAKIASSLNARFGTNYEGGGVVMTVGAAGGLNVVLKSLLDDGDEVIVVSPYFGEYRCYAANFGGKLVEVPALADFTPDCAAIEAAVGERTKAVIVNITASPDMLFSDADHVSQMIQEAVDEEAIIFWGVVYDETMDNEMRVTVIATGFDSEYGPVLAGDQKAKPEASSSGRAADKPVDRKPAFDTTPASSRKEPAQQPADTGSDSGVDDLDFDSLLSIFNK